MAVNSKSTVAEIEVELDRLDAERMAMRERCRQLMDLRNRKVREEQLDYWGLNEARYQAAKARSRATGIPPHVCLNEARKVANKDARDAQTALAEAAAVGVKGKGV